MMLMLFRQCCLFQCLVGSVGQGAQLRHQLSLAHEPWVSLQAEALGARRVHHRNIVQTHLHCVARMSPGRSQMPAAEAPDQSAYHFFLVQVCLCATACCHLL